MRPVVRVFRCSDQRRDSTETAQKWQAKELVNVRRVATVVSRLINLTSLDRTTPRTGIME